jgi:hypothetical protein
MPTGLDVPSKFFIHRSDDDCIVDITIHGRNQKLKKALMDYITFELPDEFVDYEFSALPTTINTSTLDRKIFVKKKN